VPVKYDPPADLPAKITELVDARQNPAKALMKSLLHALASASKRGDLSPVEGSTIETRAERLALEIERAVHDTHPNQKEYALQVRTLSFNLKSNQELCNGLLRKTLAPTGLAAMTSDELASKELQRETAEMKARAEKQSILITEDGPRMRRTHKGEEVIETEGFMASDETPSVVRRPSVRDTAQDSSRQDGMSPTDQSGSRIPLHVDTLHSPKHPDFDIKKVFSSVKSPTTSHQQRASGQLANPAGPGFDPDVDRLLQEETDSPPYSPTEETDPDIIWRGSLVMNSIADFHATAKFAAGANLQTTQGLPWSTLIPRRLTVAGRIDEQKAIEYLCGLRYNDLTDIIVIDISPVSESARSDYNALIEYFVSKKRYGVVGDKGIGNVRDTYLVPVLPGDGNFPEFMLNFSDNHLPQKRSEPTLLVVFVYRNDSSTKPAIPGTAGGLPQSISAASPTPGTGGFPRQPSISGPAFSPTSPQGAFPAAAHQQPQPIAGQTYRGPPPAQTPTAIDSGAVGNRGQLSDAARQQAGQTLAAEILGSLISSPTVQFLLPQAFQMTRKEWEVVRQIFERDPRARDDLQHLSILLEKEGNESRSASAASTPVPVQNSRPAA
jgi:hypothetical protein